MGKKVILAYSGGLDTSVAIKWLSEKGYQVIAYSVDIGQETDLLSIKKRTKIAGATKVIIEDLKDEFVKDYCFLALKADAVYESKYFLATALSRPLIAKRIVSVAKKEGAEFVAHGCTGKGNDQVRIELGVNTLAPELKIIAPAREWEFSSREAEIRYAKTHHIPVEATKKSPYSIDKNLWGVSIECGVLEKPSVEPPEDAYQITKSPKDAPNKPAYVTIYFERGIPKKLNGKGLDPVSIILKLQEIGAKNGIGRTDMIENRLVGIKSREVYEAPAAVILYLAHKELQALVLDRELLHFKEQVALKYAELVYYGLWFTPLKEALDKFIEATQTNVTGNVTLKLYKGSCISVARDSKFSLYKEELATYKAGDKFDKRAAEGFIKIWGLPYRK